MVHDYIKKEYIEWWEHLATSDLNEIYPGIYNKPNVGGKLPDEGDVDWSIPSNGGEEGGNEQGPTTPVNYESPDEPPPGLLDDPGVAPPTWPPP